MALVVPTTTATAPLATLLLLLLGATGCSGTVGSERGPGAGCFAPLIGCATPSAPGAAGNATAFRASLAPLLSALPSAAAAAEGFAALRSPAPRPGRARALGLCFAGGSAASGPGCQACLWAAVAALGDGEGGCADGTRRAGVWSDGCLMAYYDGDGDESASSSGSDGGAQVPPPWFLAGDTRSCTDGLELALAHLAKDLARPKGRSLWRTARSVVFFVLAAIGTVTVVVALCLLVGGYLLLESLARTVAAAAGQQAGVAGVGLGDGIAVYVAGTNGQAPVWSVAAQLRFY
ncbi:hypothetical protein U9M48_044322 [Paspalum notatum var. saurae]|uniref:Gnk2-homologous domain-containing protein n=1 Tax=Paspalum notatum var. saurae TaxID=547442 RepID=A0AAQ3XJH0_PASNO